MLECSRNARPGFIRRALDDVGNNCPAFRELESPERGARRSRVVAATRRPRSRRRFIATDKTLAEVSVHGNEGDGRKLNAGWNDASTSR